MSTFMKNVLLCTEDNDKEFSYFRCNVIQISSEEEKKEFILHINLIRSKWFLTQTKYIKIREIIEDLDVFNFFKDILQVQPTELLCTDGFQPKISALYKFAKLIGVNIKVYIVE